MRRLDRTGFVAFGLSSALNALVMALYALNLATHGSGSTAQAQPVLFVSIALSLLVATYVSVQRGHDLGRPGWQIVLAIWISLGGGPLVLVPIAYLAWAKGDTDANGFGAPPARVGSATWPWAIILLVVPWFIFALATLLV